MNIQISKTTKEQLEWLASNWYVVKGGKPMPLEKVVERLVDRQWSEATPKEYAPYYERR